MPITLTVDAKDAAELKRHIRDLAADAVVVSGQGAMAITVEPEPVKEEPKKRTRRSKKKEAGEDAAPGTDEAPVEVAQEPAPAAASDEGSKDGDDAGGADDEGSDASDEPATEEADEAPVELTIDDVRTAMQDFFARNGGPAQGTPLLKKAMAAFKTEDGEVVDKVSVMQVEDYPAFMAGLA